MSDPTGEAPATRLFDCYRDDDGDGIHVFDAVISQFHEISNAIGDFLDQMYGPPDAD
jgi:hypothetical protein